MTANSRGGDVNPDPHSRSIPLDPPQIVLAHGGGGRLARRLIQKWVIPSFRDSPLEATHDGAVFSVGGAKIAFSTDSFVINPIFFSGGDIGKLAVNGTVNNLAMCGAKPLYLSAGFILEEGLGMDGFRRVVESMKQAAALAGVSLITGDTKVIGRGQGDQIFINTSGVGIIQPNVILHPRRAQIGDKILINGSIGQHGIAILSLREGLQLETLVSSDTAPLTGLVEAILAAVSDVHVLRDPTRGGVTSALIEIAEQAKVGMHLDESSIPIEENVKRACEILGLDPMEVANQGKLLCLVEPEHATKALAAMHRHPLGREACIIGEVVDVHPGVVTMQTRAGPTRVLDLMIGDHSPRIC